MSTNVPSCLLGVCALRGDEAPGTTSACCELRCGEASAPVRPLSAAV
ncbi:hypothetical protein STXM2123_5328 [Streptomyces sp. F-3]|nr:MULTISPECIES: hypothetical protein [Streptomyces]MDN5383434.1 hypothetical protein [Streptomyces sp. LB8]GAT84628.1 hypothetical protein STXM2123_5328 [Streptomyces sp. F-3]